MVSSSDSKTLAGPLWRNILSSTAPFFTTAPSGARLPLRTAMPPSDLYGSSRGLMTERSTTPRPATASRRVPPATEGTSRSQSPAEAPRG